MSTPSCGEGVRTQREQFGYTSGEACGDPAQLLLVINVWVEKKGSSFGITAAASRGVFYE